MAIKTEIPNNNNAEEYKKYNTNNTRSFVLPARIVEWMVGYIYMLLRGIKAKAHPLFIYKIIKKI